MSRVLRDEPTKCYKDILLVDRITYTYEVTWKNVIFLPFTGIFSSLFILLLVCNIHINLFFMCFDPIIETNTWAYYVLISFDVIYIIHTGLLVGHKVMWKHRRRRFFKPEPWLLICLDCISVLPLQYCHSFVQYFLWAPTYSESFVFYTTLLKLVRILRILFKYKDHHNSPQVENKIFITVFHFILSTIVAHIIVICYYSTCCLECHNDNLTTLISFITFDDTRDEHWFVVLFTYVHLMMLHNYWGALKNGSYTEHLLAIICLIAGLFLRYMFMMGNMITYYIRGLRYMFGYKQEHVWMNQLMSLLQFDEELIEKVNEYYRTIWTEYKGINRRPQIFAMFPVTLQREILTDIYWDAMMHTHVFATMSLAARREVASQMTTEIRMPGEVLFTTGSLKAKMVYIVSGIVQLMATENAGAPIMSFKDGTVLGSISAAMPTKSNGTFVCSTTCHFHVLAFENLVKLYKNKREMHQVIMEAVVERIKFAKIKRVYLVQSGVGLNASHVQWLKSQWRRIASKKGPERSGQKDDLFNESYSSRFLDLMVLVKEHDWHKELICLKDKCPLIMKADTSFRKFLHYVNLSVVILQFLITAECIAFDQEISPSLMPLLLVLDVFYFLDLYVQLITMPKGFPTSKPLDIMLYNARQMLFIFDIVATIPYDYFSDAFRLSKQTAACLRVPRFLKLYKLVEYFLQLEFNVDIKSLYLTKFAKFIVLHGIFIMVFVCMSYFVNCRDGNCDASWLVWSRNLNSLFTGITQVPDDYAETFHHLLSVYLGLKISNKMEINITELILSTLIATVGFYVSTYCFIQLTAVVSLQHEFTHHFLLDMDILNEITDREDLLHLKSDIIHFANVQWNLNKNQNIKNIYTVMGQESEYLRNLVTKEFVMKAFSNTQLFEQADPRFLRQLADNSNLLVIPKGHTIYDHRFKIYYLYLIVEGSIQYRSLLPCDLANGVTGFLERNNCFPVISLFEEVTPLIAVSSMTTLILLSVPYLVIKQLLRAFPKEGAVIRKACAIHKAEHEANIREVGKGGVARLSDLEYKKVPTFTYSTERSCRNVSFYYGLTKMETFFRKLLYTTYDPNSRSYIWYEVFRSACIIIQVAMILFATMPEFYLCLIGSCGFIPSILWLLGCVDIYIRGHVQYYNHLGIKVTKLSRTFKHYVDTSFPTDFISTFPYQMLGISGLFYHDPMRAYLLMLIVMRSLALYRPVKLFTYIKNSVNPKYQIYFFVCGAIIIAMYFFATTTHIYLVFSCNTKAYAFDVHEESWINMYTSLERMKQNYLYLIIYYVVSSMTITYTYSTYSSWESLQQLLLVLYIFIMKMFFVTYVLGCESHGNIRTAKHQDAIRDYLGFTAKKLISNATKREMIDHVGNYWEKSSGAQMRKIFENFSPFMQEEIFLSLYKQALMYCYFFHDSEESIYRLIVNNLDELYYKKDADILRTNDVQDYLYIVASGHVNVYLADIYLCTLWIGGIFGCFNPKGMMRQTIHVRASVHVKILCIKTVYLYEIAAIYRVLYCRLQNVFSERREYIQEMFSHRGVVTSFAQARSIHTWRTKVRRKNTAWFFKTIYEGNIIVQIWNYAMNVHVVSLSSTYCLHILAVHSQIPLLWVWILLDVCYLAQIYIRCHTAYTDLETGVSVFYFEAIAKRYVKSLRFYVDVTSILPLYMIGYFFNSSRPSIYLLNKIIRVGDLYTYYYSYVVRKNVPRHLKWTFLVYNTMFLLQLVFDMWHTVSDYEADIKAVKCFLRVFSVYTAAGLVEREFHSEDQLLVNLVLIYVSQALLIYMLVVSTRLLIDYNYTVSIFKISLEVLMTYCKNELLSKPLAEKIFAYLVYLYKNHNGRQDPILFQSAPSYILQDHKAALYGRFIEAHFPFSSAHIDFLRQLFECVDVGIYLPGDMIVEVGDCNSTMYFIEVGEVIEIEEHKGELRCKVIKEGMFGRRQGLSNVDYTKTYRAMTVCSIISVCRHKWAHLLEFFPATREIINEAIAMDAVIESEESDRADAEETELDSMEGSVSSV